MKRDPDLIRAILARVEAADDFDLRCADLVDDHHDEASVARHVELLEEAGYLKANLLKYEAVGAVGGTIERLTWEGHEFLETARSDTTWEKAKRTVGEKVGGVSFELLRAFLISYAKVQLGLPVGE